MGEHETQPTGKRLKKRAAIKFSHPMFHRDSTQEKLMNITQRPTPPPTPGQELKGKIQNNTQPTSLKLPSTMAVPTSWWMHCMNMLLMKNDINERDILLEKLRSKEQKIDYAMMVGLYLVMTGIQLSYLPTSVYLIVPIFMVLLLLAQICSLSQGNDTFVIVGLRMTQTWALFGGVLFWFWAHRRCWTCPAETSSTVASTLPGKCTTNASDMNPFHATSRGGMLMYGCCAVLPVHLLMHMIPIKNIIVPVVVILGSLTIAVQTTFVNASNVAAANMYPLFVGIAIITLGFRVNYMLRQSIETRKKHDKEKMDWMSTVSHNIGTPLTTIVYSTNAMFDICKTSAKDSNGNTDYSTLIRPYLHQQRVAADYLRSVYTTVMYHKGGKMPVCKNQKIEMLSLIKSCEAITSSYGMVMHPDVTVVYFKSIHIPEYIVADWTRIQQCVVNLGKLYSSLLFLFVFFYFL